MCDENSLNDMTEHLQRTGADMTRRRFGLLAAGVRGVQLTWMDAKMGDWVVTPRRGKAVELNALWYNAVRLLERWVGEEQGVEAAARYSAQAERIRQSFNRRFWNEQAGYLYDVIDSYWGVSASNFVKELDAITASGLSEAISVSSAWNSTLGKGRPSSLTIVPPALV